MKVKEILECLKDYDPESELEFELFEEKNNGYGDYEVHTTLVVTGSNYLDETDTVFITLRTEYELMRALGIV